MTTTKIAVVGNRTPRRVENNRTSRSCTVQPKLAGRYKNCFTRVVYVLREMAPGRRTSSSNPCCRYQQSLPSRRFKPKMFCKLGPWGQLSAGRGAGPSSLRYATEVYRRCQLCCKRCLFSRSRLPWACESDQNYMSASEVCYPTTFIYNPFVSHTYRSTLSRQGR